MHNQKFIARFMEILSLLCHECPPKHLCELWLESNDARAVQLQEWVVENTVLGWAQGIELIDAAYNITLNPAYPDFESEQIKVSV